MITPTSNATSANSSTDFTMTLPANSTSTAGSTDPFTQELASALGQYLNQAGNSTSSQININIAQSQVSAGSQFVVTITEPGATTEPGAAQTAAQTTGNDPLMASTSAAIAFAASTAAAASAGASSPAATATATAAASPAANPLGAAGPTAAQLANMTPDEAYWAEQPAAVQALQNMPLDQRAQAAQALAQQGYTIDVPIMVDGGDPLTIMMERQQYGYTWVPSAMQSPVDLAPGLSFAGLTPYDPNNPPAGSIQVTTDFAKGTNMQDVFFDPASIEASFSNANFGAAAGMPASTSPSGTQGVVAS
jgi:hypothetical protein